MADKGEPDLGRRAARKQSAEMILGERDRRRRVATKISLVEYAEMILVEPDLGRRAARTQSLVQYAEMILGEPDLGRRLARKISLHESAEMICKTLSSGSEDITAVATKAFDLLDVDGNGCIQRGDLEIFLNLTGIESIDTIGTKAKDLMNQIDSDKDGNISREEWADSWISMQKEFGNFFNDKTLKKKIEVNFGIEGPSNIPLYVFGNVMSFYRLPLYPAQTEDRPEGCSIADD